MDYSGTASLRCTACNRACEYHTSGEVREDDDVYFIQPGEVIFCNHCGERHEEGMSMVLLSYADNPADVLESLINFGDDNETQERLRDMRQVYENAS